MPARLAAAKAHRLQPDNQAIAQVAALLNERAEDWKRAAGYWVVVARAAKSAQQRDWAQSRLDKVNALQAAAIPSGRQ
jgi:hypothetical protein